MRTIQATFYALIALAFCGTSAAQISRVSLDIESQPVRLALKDLGEQTGLQIMFRAEDVATDEMATPRIAGELSAQEALEKILANTGLQYRFVNPNTVLVLVKGGAEKTAVVPEAGGARVAQGETGKGAGEDPRSTGNEGESGSSRGDSEKEGGVRIEEIVVTAQKREENVQDIPMSITALSGETLTRQHIDNALDLSRVVSSLAVTETSPGQQIITIRGIGGIRGSSSLTGLYLDEVPVSGSGQLDGSYPDLRALDLERVEVLKGTPLKVTFGSL